VRADNVFPVGHLHRDDEEVGGGPRVAGPAVERELGVRSDVARRASDEQQEREEGGHARQRSAEEDVVEHGDHQGDARAEDDDGLDVGVLERLCEREARVGAVRLCNAPATSRRWSESGAAHGRHGLWVGAPSYCSRWWRQT